MYKEQTTCLKRLFVHYFSDKEYSFDIVCVNRYCYCDAMVNFMRCSIFLL